MTTQSGILWSFLRSTLTQGAAIAQDNADKMTELYSARLDAAASERVEKLERLLARPELTDADRIAAYVETLSVADGAGGLHLRVTTAGSIEGRLFADAIRGMK